jgi:alpha-N-arabinofuranosidase
MGHRSADDYGKFALEAAKLMKLTDPNVQLVAAGSSDFGPRSDWTGWNRTVLEYLKRDADYLSLHTYVGNQANDYYEFLASSLELADRTRTAEGIINMALSGEQRNRKIYIAWDEWNVWYRARGNKERGRRILEEKYNLEDALVVATFLNTFVNHAHIVKIANMAQLVNVIAPIFTNDQGLVSTNHLLSSPTLRSQHSRASSGAVRRQSHIQAASASTRCPIWTCRRRSTMERW